FNGDGRPDLLIGWTPLEDSGGQVAYHDGVDNFLPPTLYLAGTPGRSGHFPAVGDFDHNGRDDVVLAIDSNAPEAKLSRWEVQPGGGLAYVDQWQTYDLPQTLIAADMNQDGLDDLLVRHTGWRAI